MKVRINTKLPQQEVHDTSSNTPVRDTREGLSAKKKIETCTNSRFSKIIISDKSTSGNTTVKPTPKDTTKTTQTQTETHNTKRTTQTLEPQNTTSTTQTPDRSKDNAEICIQEELTHRVKHPTMGPPTQLEASHEMITEGIVATVEKATSTVESEDDTPLFRQKLQGVLGVRFIAAATKKDRNPRPLINFVKKRDWEAIKASYGQYWHNIWNRLHVRDDCLLVDETNFLPTHLRQTVIDSLHLTHPGSAAMLDLSYHVWFPHIHRAVVQMAQKCKHCTEQGKNLKPS